MKNRSWLAWTVLCAAAVLGGKWMQADDGLPADVREAESVRVDPGAPPPFSLPEDEPQGAVRLNAPPPPPSRLPADFEEEDFRPPAPVSNVRTTSFMPEDTDEALSSTPESSDLLNKQTEQSVTLEWVGPAQIKVGQPFIYELVARNVGSAVAHDVMVRDKFHAGMKVTAVDPKGIPEADGILWKLGEIEPRQERRIRLEMVAEKKGDVVCNATITTTTVASARFRVSEPQLVVKQTSPENAMIGDTVSVAVSISNPGDGPADNITIRSTLGDGLKHEKGSEFVYELGSLSAGETRTVNIVCTAIKGGKQSVKTTANSGTLEAQSESSTQITEPKIDVVISGPRLRYLDRTATYVVAVSNPGDAIANNVKVTATTPPGFKFAGATNGGRHDYATRSIEWFVGTLAPGETKEVSYKCLAIQAGQHNHVVVAAGQRGLKAESTVETTVEGIAAILLEVVDIDDPVEVGADTAYEIRVTNQGSREATNVEIHALVPREMQVRGGQGPTNYRTDGQEVIFAPLPKLAPRADAIYRVFVRGVGVGDVRFRARLISDSLSEPVIEEESTKIYDD